MPRGHGAARQRHPARHRRIQELHHQREDWRRPYTSSTATSVRPRSCSAHVFCIAADEDEFRYGTVLFHEASKDDVEPTSIGGALAEPLPERKGW